MDPETLHQLQKQPAGRRRVRVRLEGTTPLLLNPFQSEEFLTPEGYLKRRIGHPKPDLRTPEEIAATKVLRNAGGKIGLPIEYLWARLINAGRKVKLVGNRQLSTATATRLYGLLDIEEEFLVFEGEPTWKANFNMTCSGKLGIVRVRFDQWSFWVTLEFNPKRLPERVLRELILMAGRFGICSAWNSGRRPFGQFRMTDWQVLDHKPSTETEDTSR